MFAGRQTSRRVKDQMYCNTDSHHHTHCFFGGRKFFFLQLYYSLIVYTIHKSADKILEDCFFLNVVFH